MPWTDRSDFFCSCCLQWSNSFESFEAGRVCMVKLLTFRFTHDISIRSACICVKKLLFFCTVHRIYRTNVACSTENEWDQKWKKKKQTIIVFLVNTDFYLLFCCAASINCLLLSLALAYQTAIRFVAALRFSLQLFVIISFSAYVALWVLLILCRVCVQRIERTVNATKQQAQSHGSQHTAKEMKSGVRFFSSCVWVLFCKISRCVYLTQWPNPNFSDCCC